MLHWQVPVTTPQARSRRRSRSRRRRPHMASYVLGALLIGLGLVAPMVTLRYPRSKFGGKLRTGTITATSANTRVAWACETLGSLACLEQKEEPLPAMADEECVIGVKAIGLNYADVFCVLGLYEAANKFLKDSGEGALVPGLEFSGEVLEAGKGVSKFKKGDRVYGFTRFGAYRTKVVAREKLLQPMPSDWSYAEGAALLVQGLTAWHGLVVLGNAKAGSSVLVHSAAGGVGCAALQICETLGCTSVGVVGSDKKIGFLKERYPSCTPLVHAKERKYKKQLDEVGKEYDVVLESLGGGYLTAALDHVEPMGRLVHFGATHAYGGTGVDGLLKWLKLIPNYLARPLLDPGKMVPKNQAVFGFNLIWLTEREDELTVELNDMLTRGGLNKRPPAVGRTFPFSELPAAVDHLRSGDSVGKVVVTVD